MGEPTPAKLTDLQLLDVYSRSSGVEWSALADLDEISKAALAHEMRAVVYGSPQEVHAAVGGWLWNSLRGMWAFVRRARKAAQKIAEAKP